LKQQTSYYRLKTFDPFNNFSLLFSEKLYSKLSRKRFRRRKRLKKTRTFKKVRRRSMVLGDQCSKINKIL
jgi:hypothetical protein